jgi:predicted RNase H-like HicB family nuclease
MKTLTAIIFKEDDMFVAKCPEVGTISQGYSLEEALENLKEATELYLEEFPQQQFIKPYLTTFKVALSA